MVELEPIKQIKSPSSENVIIFALPMCKLYDYK